MDSGCIGWRCAWFDHDKHRRRNGGEYSRRAALKSREMLVSIPRRGASPSPAASRRTRVPRRRQWTVLKVPEAHEAKTPLQDLVTQFGVAQRSHLHLSFGRVARWKARFRMAGVTVKLGNALPYHFVQEPQERVNADLIKISLAARPTVELRRVPNRGWTP